MESCRCCRYFIQYPDRSNVAATAVIAAEHANSHLLLPYFIVSGEFYDLTQMWRITFDVNHAKGHEAFPPSH